MKKDGLARQRQHSEIQFFDKKAKRLEEADQGPQGEKGEEWLDILGIRNDVAGKDVLECACGLGPLTVVLARTAGTVNSFDISPESVKATERRVKEQGFQNVSLKVVPMEELPYEDAAFDLVVGLFILHHLADLEKAIRQISRVLKPGGKAVFYETNASNPMLMFWRRHLAGRWGIPKLGSQDEHPLTQKDYKIIASAFDGKAIFSYPNFRFFGKLYFQLFRRVRIVRPVFRGLDRLIWWCFPFFRKYSYQVMVTLVK